MNGSDLSLPRFKNTMITLMINDPALFMQKIANVPPSEYLADFQGPKQVSPCGTSTFWTEKFTALSMMRKRTIPVRCKDAAGKGKFKATLQSVGDLSLDQTF